MKNRISAIMSLIIVLSMLCQLMSHNIVACAAEESLIYAEDFSSGKLDQEWSVYLKNGSTVFGTVSAADKNLYISYSSKGSTRGVYVKREIEGLDVDMCEISFDFISGGTTGNLAQNIILHNGASGSSVMLDSKNISVYSDSVHIIMYNSDFYYVDGKDGTFKKLSAVEFESNAKYYYKAVIDNINNTYSLYLSRSEITDTTAPVLLNAPLAFSTQSAPTQLHFQFHKFAQEQHSPLIIDNIRAVELEDSIYNKLDFDGELKNIKPYYDLGDYDTVDEMLLEYYKKKSSPVSAEVSGKANLTTCELYKDLFIFDGVTFLGRMGFRNKYDYSYLDLSSAVKGGGKYSFELVADDVTSPVIEIYSKDGSSNVVLTVTADGKTLNLYPSHDTYISYDNKNTCYGYSDRMYIAERPGTNSIIGSGTMRAYIMFDLSSLAGKTITSAVLRLRGRTPAGSEAANASVWLLSDDSWTEEKLCWQNTMQSVLCFNGLGTIPFEKLTSANIAADCINGTDSFERMYWITTLTNAFRRNGTEEYAKVAIELLMSYIDHQFNTSFVGNSGLATAIRARELSKCHHHLSKSVHMTPERNIRYIEYMYALGKFLEDDANFRVNHNWGTFQILGLNHTASYFTELKRSFLWKKLAIERTGKLLENIIASDGSFVEGSTHYAYEAIRQIMKTINSVEAAGNKLSDAVRENLKRLCKYALDTSFPNGYDISYGDGGYGKIDIDVAIDYLKDDELKFINSRGESGTKPDYTSVLYPEGRNKMAVMRSGFCENDLAMYINNGAANRLSHTHPDDLSVIAYAYGNPLLIDPGSYSYDLTEQSEWQRHTTEAHNTVEIDNTPQSHADGEVIGWSTTSALDYYEGVSGAYSGFSHNRKVYFIKDRLWLVSDNITASDSSSHSYEQNWHFMTDAKPVIDKNLSKAVTTSDKKANITVMQLDEGSSASLKNGWYVDESGKLCSSEFASFTKTEKGDARFLTLLYPHKKGEAADITVMPVYSDASDVKAYEILNGNEKEIIILNPACDKSVTAGNILFEGEFLYIRKNAEGETEKLSALNVKNVIVDGKKVVSSENMVGNLSVTVSEGVMSIDTDDEGILENTDIYYSGAVNAILLNNQQTDYSQLNGRIVPGRVFSWEADTAGKEITASADLFGMSENNTAFTAALYDENGTLVGVKNGSLSDGAYSLKIKVGAKAQSLALMLYDPTTMKPYTKAVKVGV